MHLNFFADVDQVLHNVTSLSLGFGFGLSVNQRLSLGLTFLVSTTTIVKSFSII